ncbi:bacteriohemerythrin [Desulfovibrio inopinatus]|uniref:bacteriohemerythrin n=1 Tax=Desulfovibrio inopinatus TaxID=102109 RepID=UPI00040A022C|nr:bacteriohemerythrin [Desulfovibrio inopinatus]
MPFISWDPELSVGVHEIDEQHKTLLNMINQLHEGMRSGKSKEQLAKTFVGLKKYVKMHFSTEERLMEKNRFSGLSSHRTQHNKFIEKILDFEMEFEQGRTLLSMELVQFLRNWYLSHVKGVDQQYANFFKEKGIA